ncbi:ADP-ribose pyrophosphatase YjhB (NUDIX family) [Saonia flava]|uniref:ADP-ribose pyrophosphatase YjhB (NUDIX family) n=1 Tax=Saonia flava TaxID=523696 RepID=A0A846R5F9_9FLAO|nr:NUDIX domain-containing protein [Saonia flava]NJB72614.1 ADP-ribose pyrophosphatase YjhB (NUDIX family) [Saonia flava]
MIFKKQVYQPDKKTNPLIGFLLFLISIVLLVLTGPFGFIYGLFHSLFAKGFTGLGEFFLKIAISIDQLGNVLMQHLLNLLWIKKDGYKFGNRDETISSALGRNNKMNTLTSFGQFIDKILDIIDNNHSLDSIDYYIEPSKQIIDKLAWIHLADGKILSTRSKGKTKYYIPGGKRELGEPDAKALIREIKEELSVELDVSSLQFMGVFEAQADSHKPGVLVKMTCYYGNYHGTLLPDSEIEEMVWLNYKDIEMVSEVDKLIFDYLYQKGQLL